jgi:putative flippase GtrA
VGGSRRSLERHAAHHRRTDLTLVSIIAYSQNFGALARTRYPHNVVHPTPPEPLTERALRFVRALIVGGGATIVDFSVLTACIRVASVAPTSARLPALMAGASVQFFGNRTYTFRAQRGSISRQAKLFFVAEVLALAMNWSLYQLLIKRLPAVPPELVSFMGTFAVFVAFAYPLRRLVIFRVPEDR